MHETADPVHVREGLGRDYIETAAGVKEERPQAPAPLLTSRDATFTLRGRGFRRDFWPGRAQNWARREYARAAVGCEKHNKRSTVS